MCSRLTAMLLVVVLLGGNAAVVQVVGWATMLAERTQRMDWSAAVASTFSGLQPCRMCHAADRLRDDGPTTPASVSKLLKKAEAITPVPARAYADIDWSPIVAYPHPAVRPVVHRPAPEPPPPQAG